MGVNRNAQMAVPRGGQQYIIQVELTADAGQSTSTMPAEPIGSYSFVWEALGATWDESNGDWDVRIRDTSPDTAFSPGLVSIQNLIGSADKYPWRLHQPHTFAAGSGIMVEAKNNGSAADTLKLAFIGRRLPRP